jgi:hypothetical protein
MEKLENFLLSLQINRSRIWINQDPDLNLANWKNHYTPSTLIMGWGLPEKPRWNQWAFTIKTSSVIRLFIAVDLYESREGSGRVLFLPMYRKGRGWRDKTWRTRFELFLKNCYIGRVTPYGMRRMPKENYGYSDFSMINRYRLIPGPSEEIEIIRLIFRLFVDHGYMFSEISNLLNAQGVKPHCISKSWNFQKIKSMLVSAVYIGANQYGDSLKHDVFPALIDRSTFCKALARIYNQNVPSTD